MRNRLAALTLLLALFPASSLLARIISYSPYTDRAAIPAHQHRMNRYFALIEGGTPATNPSLSPVPPMGGLQAHLVLYDFRGLEEPRVIYPAEGSAGFHGAAVRESATGAVSIIALTSGQEGQPASVYRLSTDGGATWKTLAIPVPTVVQSLPTGIDIGGPFAAARGSQIRIGNEQWPFVVSTRAAVYAVGADGSAKVLLEVPAGSLSVSLLGVDATGTRFLAAAAGQIHVLDLLSGTAAVVAEGSATTIADGWITPGGAVYLEEHTGGIIRLLYVVNGVRTELFQASSNRLNLFAVPTHDYSGAWIVDRGPGKPTSLYKHTAAAGAVKQWEDITAPEVEALHAGSSGTRLLVQVHRPRPQADQRIFQDPALAIWRVGQPAPRFYDELYMDEQANKGFVHLDVEKLEAGEPFVFDSGVRWMGMPGPVVSPSPGGGGDVVQEWGVVRASLKQRLVLPAVGRTAGAFDSDWVTDVIIQNPVDAPQRVDIRFAPSGLSTVAAQDNARSVVLEPNEIRLIEDVLHSLFGIESAIGAFFIEPESGITMTSRTYSKSSEGTYGFGMHAIDVHAAAASARFPLTFAGAFLGQDYRTNLIIADAGESGSLAGVRAAGTSGLMGFSDVAFEVGARGQQQINNVGTSIGLWPFETGALLFRPARGSATAAVFAIDNRTNDPTYFPPDLPAPIVRTIPAIGHVDGANDSRFRSDLYLYNPSPQVRTVTLQMKMWDSAANATINFTMLPNEARIIRNVLQTLFGRTGIARLRYQSAAGDSSGIRVTSRTYSINDDGGTFGFLMPPLNNFQSGGMGDTLEILGAVSAADYRTNIGLVDLAAFPMTQAVNVRIEIIDAGGRVADSFTANVPSAGGMQLNDVFRSRDIDVSGPVLIRVSPLNGLVGAYATFVDNRTNDAVYLSANLAVKE
ncbi:MAG TPA: hypothetical protein VNA04_16585 [Thermoanaerobaculia bacterium]|nr:hypothetical protein [Thermoanaerobaculia bacterium]